LLYKKSPLSVHLSFFHFSEFLIPYIGIRRGGLFTRPGKHRENQILFKKKNFNITIYNGLKINYKGVCSEKITMSL